MKSNKKLESIRHFFCLSRKRKKSDFSCSCVGWCWGRGGGEFSEKGLWDVVALFLCPYNSVLLLPSLWCWAFLPPLLSHLLFLLSGPILSHFSLSSVLTSTSISYIALFTAISQPPESTHTPAHMHTQAYHQECFHFLSLLPWVYIHYISIECIHIYVYKLLSVQLVNAGSGMMNISFFKYLCEVVCIQACQ